MQKLQKAHMARKPPQQTLILHQHTSTVWPTGGFAIKAVAVKTIDLLMRLHMYAFCFRLLHKLTGHTNMRKPFASAQPIQSFIPLIYKAATSSSTHD